MSHAYTLHEALANTDEEIQSRIDNLESVNERYRGVLLYLRHLNSTKANQDKAAKEERKESNTTACKLTGSSSCFKDAPNEREIEDLLPGYVDDLLLVARGARGVPHGTATRDNKETRNSTVTKSKKTVSSSHVASAKSPSSTVSASSCKGSLLSKPTPPVRDTAGETKAIVTPKKPPIPSKTSLEGRSASHAESKSISPPQTFER